ncbi:hypothetical protein NDU88_002814 [Pleurodeles waltl]|uniref:Pesticidal crystal protein domain-containing protein n=2 Tax=Pleurodeles waltl TaxID=8319 RepID=A0AAV7SC18_PLEWA|nr:hypothetical protein NDU88_002814 [Pleurodeles waltl]
MKVSSTKGNEDVQLPSKGPLDKEEPNQPKLLLYLLENAHKLENNQTIFRTAKLGETWNDRMKELVTGLVGLINVEGIPVGKFISVLISFFWPSSAVNIWDLVKDQVEYMIDQKILAAEVNQMQNSLDGLRRTMQQYVEAKNNEKGALMGAIVASCNDLHSRLVHSNNAVHLIPLTVTLSYMHLANLKERLMHGKEIYDEDNTVVWKKDLKEEIETYQKDFEELYGKWQKWRSDSITVTLDEYKSPTTIPPFFFYVFTGDVYDKVTGKNRNFYTMQSTVVSNPTYFKEICDTVKTMLWNRANGAMLQTLVPTFFLDNFMPGSEDIPSKPHTSMQKASFGPFSYNILEGNSDRSRTVYYPSSDNSNENPVTQVNVREWNLIDGLRFFYKGTWGRFVGNPNGGLLHEIDTKGKLVHNIKISFNNGGMVDIEIIRSDGTSSGRLGNRGGWSVTRVEAGDIDTYGLYNVKMTGNNGVTQIEFFYRHFTCRPSEIKLNI